MKGQIYLEHIRDALAGSWLGLPPVDLPLQAHDQHGADVLLMLHAKYPQLDSQEMLDALEQAVWWLKLVAQAPVDPLVTTNDPQGERYDGSQLGLEVAVGLAAPRSHRHYPDGRPDCAACVFYGLVRRGAHE